MMKSFYSEQNMSSAFPDTRFMIVQDFTNFRASLKEKLFNDPLFLDQIPEKPTLISEISSACLQEIQQFDPGTPLSVRTVALNALPVVLAKRVYEDWTDHDAFLLHLMDRVKEALYTAEASFTPISTPSSDE